MKVGDLVKWRSSAFTGPAVRYCIVTSADDRYVTLTGFPQNQVFQKPDDFIIEGVRRPSPLELISEKR